MRHPIDPSARVLPQVRAIGLPDHLPHGHNIVYRFYDQVERLLYVGITVSPLARWQAHSRRADWWPLVASVAIEPHEYTNSARDAELAAIKAERPLFNILGSSQILTKEFTPPHTLLTSNVPLSLSKSRSRSERGSYLFLTLVNADTREASLVSDSLPSRLSHRVTEQADSTRWLR